MAIQRGDQAVQLAQAGRPGVGLDDAPPSRLAHGRTQYWIVQEV